MVTEAAPGAVLSLFPSDLAGLDQTKTSDHTSLTFMKPLLSQRYNVSCDDGDAEDWNHDLDTAHPPYCPHTSILKKLVFSISMSRSSFMARPNVLLDI